MESAYIVQQMLILFIIMVIGFIMYKVKIIDDAANVRFTRLVLNISLPAQIITSVVGGQGVISKSEVLIVLLISAGAYALYAIIGGIFIGVTRAPKAQRGPYLFMSMFGNCGFMGFPVISAIFGDKYLIYAVIYNILFYLLVFSVGIQMMSGAEKTRFNPRLLLNTPLISALISLALFFLDIPLPETANATLEMLGNVTTPVAMLLLGSTIAAMPLKKLFNDWRIYLFTAVRLLAFPAAAYFLLLGAPWISAEVKSVIVVLSGTPVATNSTMISIQYGGDRELAAKGIFFSTLLSVATIPLIASLLCS